MNQEAEAALAKQYNATATPDDRRGPGWNRYKLNGRVIWENPANKGWATAMLVEDRHVDHHYTTTLEEAFRYAIHAGSLVLPVVHLNGTSREELMDQREKAWEAIGDAFEAVKQMAPNGRDYYPIDGLLEKAIEQHKRRLRTLQELQDELQEEIDRIGGKGA